MRLQGVHGRACSQVVLLLLLCLSTWVELQSLSTFICSCAQYLSSTYIWVELQLSVYFYLLLYPGWWGELQWLPLPGLSTRECSLLWLSKTRWLWNTVNGFQKLELDNQWIVVVCLQPLCARMSVFWAFYVINVVMGGSFKIIITILTQNAEHIHIFENNILIHFKGGHNLTDWLKGQWFQMTLVKSRPGWNAGCCTIL